ncbi:hypothetical protein MT997_12110 [Paenibacillus sp. OVF10]|nr:hypothetical protein MT997_12110 [Paenibacillus sp. OVF10]
MKMNVQITSVLAEQKELFLNLYNLYLYDLSEFSGEDLLEEGNMIQRTPIYIWNVMNYIRF